MLPLLLEPASCRRRRLSLSLVNAAPLALTRSSSALLLDTDLARAAAAPGPAPGAGGALETMLRVTAVRAGRCTIGDATARNRKPSGDDGGGGTPVATAGELGADTTGEPIASAAGVASPPAEFRVSCACRADRGVERGRSGSNAGSLTVEWSVGSLGGVTGSAALSLAQACLCLPPPGGALENCPAPENSALVRRRIARSCARSSLPSPLASAGSASWPIPPAGLGAATPPPGGIGRLRCGSFAAAAALLETRRLEWLFSARACPTDCGMCRNPRERGCSSVPHAAHGPRRCGSSVLWHAARRRDCGMPRSLFSGLELSAFEPVLSETEGLLSAAGASIAPAIPLVR